MPLRTFVWQHTSDHRTTAAAGIQDVPAGIEQSEGSGIRTFIINKTVFNTMSNMMKFSNGGEVTSLQMWYLMPVVSSGT